MHAVENFISVMIDLFAICFVTHINLSSDPLVGQIPNFRLGRCSGTPLAAGIGCFILSSYLLVSVEFFARRTSGAEMSLRARRRLLPPSVRQQKWARTRSLMMFARRACEDVA
ncbi:hypothetical protein DFS34DRAFT_623339 [Phlyctochytrium arcticum]|nr:hypothetical protein DFS34DRAFT_623339 [Phlyctochytrium arcticum]